jgi:cytochrome c-type protein NapC
MTDGHDDGWLFWWSLSSAGIAAAILIMHLVRRPRLDASAKVWLLLGLGVFPIASAFGANVAGFKATQSRTFCGSCHVMVPHAEESVAPEARSLSAIHARSPYFGSENCYTCHKDYGMYGYVLTKWGGMGHVYYYLTEYHDWPLEEAKHGIRIRKPLPNANCMACHTTTAPGWLAVSDHAASLDEVRAGTLSCASAGCHGYAHVGTKLGKELLPDGGARP